MNLLEGILLLVGLIGSALYSGLETGVVSVNHLRIQHMVRRGQRGAEIIQKFAVQPDLLLGTTLVGTNLCNVMISVIAASLATTLLGASALWVASLGSTLVLLVFGEYLPKAWFRSYPAYRVLPLARFLQWSGYLFYPLGMAVMHLARILIPGPAFAEAQTNTFITREELAFLTKEGAQTGELSSGEHRMMQGVLALSHKTSADIMIPRQRMVLVRPGTAAESVIELARQKSVSRIPIYDDQAGKFTGFVNIRDMLVADTPLRDRTAQDFARPPQYVSAVSRADQLLPRMRLSRQPLALVHNDREQVIGLVSIEDVLEEIVGEL